METTEKKEMVTLSIDVFSNWNGCRVERDFRFPKQGFKLSGNFPVPETNEQCQDLYGINLGELISAGVKQLTYGRDSLISKLVEEKGINSDTENLEEISQIIEGEISTAPEKREAKVKITKDEYAEFLAWKQNNVKLRKGNK